MAWKEKTVLGNQSLYGICENIAEISSNYIVQLQEISGWPRGKIIADCIVPWAIEAQRDYSAMSEDDRSEVPYFDFIDAFTEQKIQEEFGANALSDCPPITVVFN